MKILHVISGLTPGGAETVLYRLLSHERGERTENHVVVSLGDAGFYGPRLEVEGVEVHCLGMRGPRDLPMAFTRLVRLMRQVRPDVVQTWLYHGDLLGGLAAKFAGSPPVVWGIHTVHLDPGSSAVTKAIRRLCAWTSSWLPQAIVCVAQAAVESHAAMGYDRKRMVVVPNGFDLPPLEPARASARALREGLDIQPDEPIVGCVGRFHPDKDYRTFLGAAAVLATQYPRARFLMVGRGLSSDNPQFVDWIEECGLTNQVVALGPRTDIATCLLAMDVFCLPSRTEAFPLVLGEAMAAGRPVVSTDVGDAARLVADCGLIVPAEDPGALGAALIRLLDTPIEEREALGLAGRRRVADEFSMSAMVTRLMTLYRGLLGSDRSDSLR